MAVGAPEIDRLLHAAWEKDGIVPSLRADDATWLRRLSLDLVGRLPAPETVKAFLADARSDKRARAVDALLASPAWASHWAGYFDRLLLGRFVKGRVVDRPAFRHWLEGEPDPSAAG
jgi:hypothetical protein